MSGYPPTRHDYPPPRTGNHPLGLNGRRLEYSPFLKQKFDGPEIQNQMESTGPPTGYAYPPPSTPVPDQFAGYQIPPTPVKVGPVEEQSRPGNPGELHNQLGAGGPSMGYAMPPTSKPVTPDQLAGFQHQSRGGPVVEQPRGPSGDQMHLVPLNVPPGLEYLAQVDHLFVKQKVEMLEAICGCETKNKYKIKNKQGQLIYTAKEDTDCCTRNCCGPLRPFELVIQDQQEREVIHLSRPFACGSCLCPCLLQSIEVFSPPGQLVGRVEQNWSIWIPQFSVKDASGNIVLRIKGPFCTFSCCGSVEFKVMSKDGNTEVGKISKQWGGIVREAFTDADSFGLDFPIDLDVRMKAVLIGACFLIDFMYFESSSHSDGPVLS